MTLSREELLSLRELARTSATRPHGATTGEVSRLAATVLVLVVEVLRLRGTVEELTTARDDALGLLGPTGIETCLRATQRDRIAAERDARAETGKALYEALGRVSALFDSLMNMENLHVYEPTAAIVTAALAQWEATDREVGDGG